MSALTQEQLDFFSVNGYLSYGKILADDEIGAMRSAYDEIFKPQSTNLAGGGKRMLQILNVFQRHPAFLKLVHDKRILDLAEALIGPNIALFHDQALFKPAHDGGPVFWHQDNGYWKLRPANLVSCWITFDDATKENGAMQVIPGSHLKPVYHTKSQSTARLLELDKEIDVSAAVTVPLPAGGCMFHHCQTLHYTQPNETAFQRRAFAIHFMQPGTMKYQTEVGEPLPLGYEHPLLRARW